MDPGVANGTNGNVPTYLFDIYTHYMPLLHRVATIHNEADRQTADRQRAIGIGRLWYGIGGLIIRNLLTVWMHMELL